MGYRAQVVTQHREYGSSVFSDWQQFDDYYYRLTELYPDAEIFRQESQDFYEIEKGVVKKELDRLAKLGKDEPFEFQDRWSGAYQDKNGEIIVAWEAALRESPEDSHYVTLEWY